MSQPNQQGRKAWDSASPASLGAHILIVEDNEETCTVIKRRLQYTGYTSDIAISGTMALELMSTYEYTIILLDYLLPDMDGSVVVERMRSMGVKTPFIVMTGKDDEATAMKMMGLGALDYVIKGPSFIDLLPHALERALARLRGETEAEFERS